MLVANGSRPRDKKFCLSIQDSLNVLSDSKMRNQMLFCSFSSRSVISSRMIVVANSHQHIAQGQDFQVRVKWAEGSVTLWDNRVTAHTAISDYNVHNPQEGVRHGFRITTLADKPKGVNGLESTW